MFTTHTWAATDARIMSHRGYAIRKDELTPVETARLRKALMMMPAVAPEFSAGIEPFPIFYESPSRWYVPRFWGYENCGEPDGDARKEGGALRAELRFNKELRPAQLPIVKAFADGGYNGIICVPCGYGKTFMAIWLACQLRRRFLIVVHQEFLMDQWKKELEGSVPGIRVGKLQGPKAQLGEEFDCCICMLQTVCSRDWSADAFSGFGFTVFDECHFLGAQHFSRALMSIQTKHMLGLSATPDRMDKMDQVFLWYLGPIRYQVKVREADTAVEVRVLRFTSADPAYADTPTDFRGQVCRPRLCNQLSAYTPRTKAICDELEPVVREGRQLLVLSDRRGHLEEFEREFRARGFTSIGYYVGGMKHAAREESAKCSIILATFGLAAVGMNIKGLNAVALVTPKSNIIQAVGRIFRQTKEERSFDPVIYDVIDAPHDVCLRQYVKRRQFYRQCAYRIRMIRSSEDVGENVAAAGSSDSEEEGGGAAAGAGRRRIGGSTRAKKEEELPAMPMFRSVVKK
jgi:superfamily II DNA or RNA helicase